MNQLNQLKKLIITYKTLEEINKDFANEINIKIKDEFDKICSTSLNGNILFYEFDELMSAFKDNDYYELEFNNNFVTKNQLVIKNYFLSSKKIGDYLLLKNNFLDQFIPSLTKNLNKDNFNFLFELSLVNNNNELIKNLISDYPDYCKNFMNKSNASYYTNDFNVLKDLEILKIKPKSLEDWVQKNIFRFMDKIKNSINQKDVFENELFIFLNKAKSQNIKIDYYNKKNNNPFAISPPIWSFIYQNLNLYKKYENLIDAQTKDSLGNNFLQYVLNMSKKRAPDEKNFEVLQYILNSGKFNLNEKNKGGQSTYDLINLTINKETRLKSDYLKKYQIFCEKLIIENQISLSVKKSQNKPLIKI